MENVGWPDPLTSELPATASAGAKQRRRSNRVRLAIIVALAMVLSLLTPTVSQAATWQGTYGAGANKPKYNDGGVKFRYQCVGDSTNFKITGASIYMWSRGKDRIKGFQFKYRLVPAGTDGQLQFAWNWSKNTTVNFKKNKRTGGWVNASKLGQSFSSTASWDLEVKLKYPRSLRKAYTKKYRLHMATPQCGVVNG